MKSIPASGNWFVEPGNSLEKKDSEISAVQGDEVVIKVAGRGLCHTDMSFYAGKVTPRQKPIILGHEISGEVVAAEMGPMLGRLVMIFRRLHSTRIREYQGATACRTGEKDKTAPGDAFAGRRFFPQFGPENSISLGLGICG